MPTTSRPDHFFQTEFVYSYSTFYAPLTLFSSSQLDEVNRKARKSYNISGNPIKLPSKLLAVVADPAHNGTVYVAESAATIKRVELDSRQVTHTYKGPTAPLTSLCLSADGTKIYAGCWDKQVWSWDSATCAVISKFQGHTDFVKSVLFQRTSTGQDVLISGGAEGDVLIWNPETSQRLAVIKGQSCAIQDLVLDPEHEESDLRLFAAFSDPAIRYFTLSNLQNLQNPTFSSPIPAHDTNIYKVRFDSDGDLWTASADKTAKHLVRFNNWKSDLTLHHPDFVRDIVVNERYGWVITACRDEDIRVWNLATGDLYHTFSGHFDEVTGLCLLGDKLVSISIDGTIRQWSLNPSDLQKAREEAAQPSEAEPEKMDESLLTAEEERELAELMENEEQELQELIANDEQ